MKYNDWPYRETLLSVSDNVEKYIVFFISPDVFFQMAGISERLPSIWTDCKYYVFKTSDELGEKWCEKNCIQAKIFWK